MKRMRAFTMALIMAFVLTVPAFATPRSGSGYKTGTVIKNGASYPVTVSLAADSSHAVYTTCSTEARVSRTHNKITVIFRTAHDGYITATGGEKTTGIVYGPTSSAKVACPCNAEDFVSYMGMNGSVTLYGDSTITLTVSA